MDMLGSLTLAMDEIVLSLSSLILLLVAAWGGVKSARLVSILAVAALVGAGIIACGTRGEAFDGLLIVDDFGTFAKLLIYGASAVVLMISPHWLAQDRAMRAEYPVLILLAVIGMSLMVQAGDFLTLYIGLELNSLAAYVLAAFVRTDQKSSEAGLKYFVLGALASGILLFGISLIYGFTGATDFLAVSDALSGNLATGAMFGLIFVVVGLAFKIAAVPFHMWTPDVYEGAPTPVTAFFATAANVAAMALLVRVMIEALGSQFEAWQPIVIFLALASIVLGAVAAIGQQSLKRLLAYSGINNVGFVLIGLAAGTQAGIAGVMTYLAIYVPTTLAGFIAVMALGRNADGTPRDQLSDISGLSRTRPGVAVILAIVMFSLAGIPPLWGFWAKLGVFQAAVAADLVPLAAIGIAASVIGAFYYLKVVKTMYFDDPAEAPLPMGLTLAVLGGLMALIVSPLGYFANGWLGAMAANAAAALS